MSNIEKHLQPDQLERYSFLWSEARLVIAAVALLLGGIPVLRFLVRVPALYGLVGSILTLTWILSGLASGYLLYRWLTVQKLLFGKKETKDTVAFLISTVSGINLGLVGLAGTNIGMSISSSYAIFVIAAILYFWSAFYLYLRLNEHRQKIF